MAHTKVITAAGADLHEFDMPSIFLPSFLLLILILLIRARPPLPSFHFRSPHLVFCHHFFFFSLPFVCLFVSFSDSWVCPLRTKTQQIVFNVQPSLWFTYLHLNFPSVFQSRLHLRYFFFLCFLFPSANLLIICFSDNK